MKTEVEVKTFVELLPPLKLLRDAHPTLAESRGVEGDKFSTSRKRRSRKRWKKKNDIIWKQCYRL